MANELPIGFTAKMIRAIREGRKTATRRVIKIENPEFYRDVTLLSDGTYRFNGYGTADFKLIKPRYQVGDLLWVKEGWRCTGGGSERNIIYKADGDTPMSFCGVDDARKSILRVAEPYWAEWDRLVYETDKGCNWRSPRFMPKWVARTWLEVVSVRAEQLQDISHEDCYAEGIESQFSTNYKNRENIPIMPLRSRFKRLWDSIYAKRGYSWESNPWVWVYEFKEYPKNSQ